MRVTVIQQSDKKTILEYGIWVHTLRSNTSHFCLAFLETAGDLMFLVGDPIPPRTAAPPPILRMAAGIPFPVGVTIPCCFVLERSSTTKVSLRLLLDDCCCCCWNWSWRFVGRPPRRDEMLPDTGLACFLIAFSCCDYERWKSNNKGDHKINPFNLLACLLKMYWNNLTHHIFFFRNYKRELFACGKKKTLLHFLCSADNCTATCVGGVKPSKVMLYNHWF